MAVDHPRGEGEGRDGPKRGQGRGVEGGKWGSGAGGAMLVLMSGWYRGRSKRERVRWAVAWAWLSIVENLTARVVDILLGAWRKGWRVVLRVQGTVLYDGAVDGTVLEPQETPSPSYTTRSSRDGFSILDFSSFELWTSKVLSVARFLFASLKHNHRRLAS